MMDLDSLSMEGALQQQPPQDQQHPTQEVQPNLVHPQSDQAQSLQLPSVPNKMETIASDASKDITWPLTNALSFLPTVWPQIALEETPV